MEPGTNRELLTCTSSVEVLGRYSNLADQGERIDGVIDGVPDRPRQAISKATKHVHRRLLPAQIDQLVEDYQAGATLNELAQKFQVHRNNVSRALEASGVPRRYRMMEGERLQDAISAYQAGKSLATIGNELGVSMDTVRVALNKAGIALRPRRGWKYR